MDSPTNDCDILVDRLGGYGFIRSIIPAAADMDPRSRAAKSIFLTEPRFNTRRDELAKELHAWIELLSEEYDDVGKYIDSNIRKAVEYHRLFVRNITLALRATRQLETAYRTIDLFFKNANCTRASNIRIVNACRKAISCGQRELIYYVEQMLDFYGFDYGYSLLVIPGFQSVFYAQGSFEDRTALLKWADAASRQKVLLISDHGMECSVKDLIKETARYKGGETQLRHVVMTANWINVRTVEGLSDYERLWEENLFVPPSAALAGKLHNEDLNIAQSASGRRYGTLCGGFGVEFNDINKSEIVALLDNHVIPMLYNDGRVMAYGINTLFDGVDMAWSEYPNVRIENMIVKTVWRIMHWCFCENWDPFTSPFVLKKKINNFLFDKKKDRIIEAYRVDTPSRDHVTRCIRVKVEIMHWGQPQWQNINFVMEEV